MRQRITSHDVGECDPDCYKCHAEGKATEAYYLYLEDAGLKEADLSFADFEQAHLTSLVRSQQMSDSDARSLGWRGSVHE